MSINFQNLIDMKGSYVYAKNVQKMNALYGSITMEKKIRVLYEIQKGGMPSQRKIARVAGISVGLANRLLKELSEESLVASTDRGYEITEEGIALLEQKWKERQEQKLSAESAGTVKEAVILAAGANDNFDCPVGMLSLDSLPLIEYLIGELNSLGIERICLVCGFQIEKFREYLKNRDITIVENSRYLWTGTMASLACAREFLTGDFMLVESNQIMDQAGLERVLGAPSANACLLVNPSGSSDEVYVELDEEGNIFRISKDIRQMNRVDAELVGASKISRKLYLRMLDYYKNNENPLLNYEYVLENIGRIFKIPAIREDDLQWSVIENETLYKNAKNLVYPRIQKKNRIRRENRAKEIFLSCMEMEEGDILDFHVCGGMTNTNFYVRTGKGEYILRVPGAGTSVMINRHSERKNAVLGQQLGINVPTLYFNEKTGVKITSYIPGAETLNGKTAQWEGNIRKTTELLRRLHTSDIVMENSFSVQREYEKYKAQVEAAGGVQYPGFEEMDAFFYHLMERLETIGLDSRPCHNDLVPENFIKDENGRIYLIDWEYSGKNDPAWDLAAHLLEVKFTRETSILFLENYYQGPVPDIVREKILIFEICQDILWSEWTRLKELKGEDFGSYGVDRLQSAMELKEKYEKNYEKTNKRKEQE